MCVFVIFIIRTVFYPKSDEICIGIILKLNFELPTILAARHLAVIR